MCLYIDTDLIYIPIYPDTQQYIYMYHVLTLIIDSTAHVVEDLLPSVSYIFRVSAVNEAGYGPHSKPSDPVTIPNEPGYDSDSPSLLEEVRVKTTPFKLEYTLGPEISRWVLCFDNKCPPRCINVLKLIRHQMYM